VFWIEPRLEDANIDDACNPNATGTAPL